MFNFDNVRVFEWEWLWKYQFENRIGLEGIRIKLNSLDSEKTDLTNNFSTYINELKNQSVRSDKDWASYYHQFLEQEKHSLDFVVKWNNYSLCVILFAFLEFRLKIACVEITNSNMISVSQNVEKFGIKESIKFLTKKFGISWEKLKSTHVAELKNQHANTKCHNPSQWRN